VKDKHVKSGAQTKDQLRARQKKTGGERGREKRGKERGRRGGRYIKSGQVTGIWAANLVSPLASEMNGPVAQGWTPDPHSLLQHLKVNILQSGDY
jgi:hypothetical protein